MQGFPPLTDSFATDSVAQNPDAAGDGTNLPAIDAAIVDGTSPAADVAFDPCDAPGTVTEICNGVDDDCDGQTDEATCVPSSACVVSVCVGAAQQCVESTLPEQTPCEHHSACTLSAVCAGGACLPTAVTDCVDGQFCTFDDCDPAIGCVNSVKQNAACDDGDACSIGEKCTTTGCMDGVAKVCDDGNSCTDDSCAAALGCFFKAKLDVPCDDDNPCTIGESCALNGCIALKSLDCNDGNPCTSDSCAVKTGICGHAVIPDCKSNAQPCQPGIDNCSSGVCDEQTASCVDCLSQSDCPAGTLCQAKKCKKAIACKSDKDCKATQQVCAKGEVGVCVDCVTEADCALGQACAAYGCQASAQKCTSSKQCAEVCDSLKGICVGCVAADDCGQDMYCAEGSCVADVCAANVCSGLWWYKCAQDGGKYLPASCDDADPCTADSCHPVKGCAQAPLSGGPCDDGDACTTTDLCAAGICSGAGAPVCDDGNVCTADSCAPAKGCVTTPVVGVCSDNDVCTQFDVCGGGVCKPGIKVACEDNKPCTTDSCHPKSGCQHVPNSLPCDDGDPCTDAGKCASGSCTKGPAKTCDDGHVCTNDKCVGGVGCVHTNNSAPCDADGTECTKNDSCLGGDCKPGPANDCDDGNPCTVDSCQQAQGKCAYDGGPKAGVVCVDGNVCTLTATCQAGKCVATKSKICDDANPCTDDKCLAAPAQCAFTANAALCNDGDQCTVGDICANSQCVAGKKKDCGDANACTADVCAKASGACAHPALIDGSPCDDGSKCSNKDACKAGVCQSGPALNCDDGITCTSDGCDAKQGCSHVLKQGCVICKTDAGCDDNNPCTVDACDKASGDCGHEPTQAPCSDGKPCTTTDHCSGGKCLAPAMNVAATAAGGEGGFLDGPVAKARFGSVNDVEPTPDGGAFVLDSHRVRRISASGIVTTVAGGKANGYKDDYGPWAKFYLPERMAYAAKTQTLYICDRNNKALRTLDAKKQVKTLVKGISPHDVAIASDGTLRVADSYRVLRVTPAGQVTVIAGSIGGMSRDGPGQTARFRVVHAIAVGPADVVYTLSAGRIRKVLPNGVVITLSGHKGAYGKLQDGPPDVARYASIGDLSWHPLGFLALAQYNVIRKIGLDGTASTLWKGDWGTKDGPQGVGQLQASGIGIDSLGAIWCSGKNNVRKLGVVPVTCDDHQPCTADACQPTKGCVATPMKNGQGCSDGDACTTADVCTAGKCNGKAKVCTDSHPCRTPICDNGSGECTWLPQAGACDDGLACTKTDACNAGTCASASWKLVLIAGSGISKHVDGVGPKASFMYPTGLGKAADGGLYVADGWRVRKVDEAGKTVTIAGTSSGHAEGKLDVAKFGFLSDVVAVGKVLYLVDSGNSRIRTVDLAKGWVQTLAGAKKGYKDGHGGAAQFNNPRDITHVKDGTFYVTEPHANRIRRIKNGQVTTLVSTLSGNIGGPLPQAKFFWIQRLTFDTAGNLFVADHLNDAVRVISGQFVVRTLLGGNGCYLYKEGHLGDPPVCRPTSLAVLPDGSVFVGGKGNIVRMAPNGWGTQLVKGYKGYFDDMEATSATALYVVSVENRRVYRLSPTNAASCHPTVTGF